MKSGIIQFYLKDRGFGYIRIPETGEEYHFSKKNLTEKIENKDQIEFEIKKTKQGFCADNIKKI